MNFCWRTSPNKAFEINTSKCEVSFCITLYCNHVIHNDDFDCHMKHLGEIFTRLRNMF
jgi:hypothetical protein